MNIVVWRKTMAFVLLAATLLIGVVLAIRSSMPIPLITALVLAAMLIPAKMLEKRGKLPWLASAVVSALSGTFVVLSFSWRFAKGYEKDLWTIFFGVLAGVYAVLALQIALGRHKRGGQEPHA
jgi:hypothetical protein